MVGNIITKDVGRTGFSPLEAGMTAVAKIISESFLARVPFVGNGTLRSGLIKMVGAGFVGTMVKDKFGIGKAFGVGMMVDGGEDIVRGLLGGSLGLGGSGNQEIGGNTSNQGQEGGVAI